MLSSTAIAASGHGSLLPFHLCTEMSIWSCTLSQVTEIMCIKHNPSAILILQSVSLQWSCVQCLVTVLLQLSTQSVSSEKQPRMAKRRTGIFKPVLLLKQSLSEFRPGFGTMRVINHCGLSLMYYYWVTYYGIRATAGFLLPHRTTSHFLPIIK